MRTASWGTVAVLIVVGAACSDDAARTDGTNPDPPIPATAAPVIADTAAPTTVVPDDPAPGDDVAADGLRLLSISAEPIELQTAPAGFEDSFDGGSFFFEGTPDVVYVAAEGGTFDLTAHRPTYDDPIGTTATIGGRRVALPDDAVSDWSGLDDFFELEVIDATGGVVNRDTVGFCPENGERIRVSPDGPVESVAFIGCGLSMLGIGTRWTLDEGWAVSALPDLSGIDAPPGDYTMRLSVATPYEDLFLGPTEVEFAIVVTELPPSAFFSLSDLDEDGIDDAIDDDMDGDGILDDEDPLISNDPLDLADSDADGIIDGLDDVVDLDADGFDDRFGTEATAFTGLDDEFAEDAIDGDGEEEPEHHGRTGPDADPPLAALPDLRSLPAFSIEAFADDESGLDLLSFAAITWNAGPAPMVVDGFAREDDPDIMDAHQQFGDAPGLTRPSAPIGTLEYHAGGGHDHWHFTDFARYDLVTEDGNEVQRSGKESWCLADTDPIDLRSRSARTVVEGSLESSCGDRGARWVRETLAVGWGDQYDQSRAGQAFDITDVPNGRYLIRISANPEGSIYEVDHRNNIADRLVILGGTAGDRTVEVPPLGRIDTEEFEVF